MENSGPRSSSVTERIRDANRDSRNPKEFVTAVAGIVWGSIIVLILRAILAASQIAMIVIGTLYLNDCPVQRFIPIYLITGGTVGTVKFLMDVAKKKYENEDRPVPNSFQRCGSILDCFLAVWFIAGCVWVYGNYLPNFDNPNGPEYCNKTVYYFAFVTLSVSIAIAVFSCLCTSCIVTWVTRKD